AGNVATHRGEIQPGTRAIGAQMAAASLETNGIHVARNLDKYLSAESFGATARPSRFQSCNFGGSCSVDSEPLKLFPRFGFGACIRTLFDDVFDVLRSALHVNVSAIARYPKRTSRGHDAAAFLHPGAPIAVETGCLAYADTCASSRLRQERIRAEQHKGGNCIPRCPARPPTAWALKVWIVVHFFSSLPTAN